MFDKIKIENLEVFGNHGVFKEETVLGQKFLVSVVLYTDTRAAGMTDQLEKSAHYGEVCHLITQYMKSNTFQLIESVAEHTAREVLLHFPTVKKIQMEIKKPWAPIGLPLETVSVEIERGWNQVFIALGSNIGDKEQYLNQAIKELSEKAEIRMNKVSDFIKTKPYGYTEQEDFLNGAIEIETVFAPDELLEVLHTIEQNAERKREIHWGPRTLDLDILLYDDEVIETENLIIPHVDMVNRDFVLLPMCQISPNKRHPMSGKTMKELLEELGEKTQGGI